MLSTRNIPRRARYLLFAIFALVDLGVRAWAATLQAQYVSWSSNMSMADTFQTMGEATGVAVPVMVAPLVLSPIAYVLGQVLLLAESAWVRIVSAFFIAASFVIWDVAEWLSVFLAGLAYLILVSGMLRVSKAQPHALE